MNGHLLADRAVGCLAGAAVGDALGGATEGWESHEISDHFGGWVEGVVESIRRARGIEKPFSPFHKGDGHVTDDTLMTRVLVHAYDVKRDHLDAYDVELLMLPEIVDKPTWIPELGREDLLYHRLFLAEKWLVLKLRYGNTDPRDAGVGNIVNCGAAMYIAPVGIANAGDPLGAYTEALDLTGAHQSSYGREAAGVMAACVGRGAATRAPRSTASSRRRLRLAKDGTRAAIEAVVETAAGLDGWRSGGLEQLRATFAPYDSSATSTRRPPRTRARPAACTRSRSCRSRSGCSSRPAATTPRPSSAASTTGATRTRSPRWAARSPVRSGESVRFGATGSRRCRRRAGSTSRTRAAGWPSSRPRSSPRTRGAHEERAQSDDRSHAPARCLLER